MLNLKAGNLSQESDAVHYTYRGKGGKRGKRELPPPALRAIQRSLEAFGKDLATMKPEESLWPSSTSSGRGITMVEPKGKKPYNRQRRQSRRWWP